MEAAESAIYNVIEKLLSWSPRRIPCHVISRDYWMPDSSCSVCYECDSQFNLFNRRHHCRICGRIFCGKCTQNKLSTADPGNSRNHEAELVRACNFCFNSRELESANLNGLRASTPSLTPSSSSRSLASNNTGGGSSIVSSACPGLVPVGSSFRTNTAHIVDAVSQKENGMIFVDKQSSRFVSSRRTEESRSPYDFCNIGRMDNEDEEFHREAESHHRLQEVQGCNKGLEASYCVDVDAPCFIYSTILPRGPSPSGELTMEAVPNCNSWDNQGHCLVIAENGLQSPSELPVQYYGRGREVATANSLYATLYKEPLSPYEGELPFDVENNTSIWVPPPPEDEEDGGITIGDDDDDNDDDNNDDVEGAWGLARSLGSSHPRNGEKAGSEEQRKAMKAVVDAHFRVLVAQLLTGEGLQAEEGDKESWLEIVTALSLQAASFVKPDTSRGGGMDPGGYVKVKCVATGQPNESYVVKGIVCKKNVAHKRMTSRVKSPRLLLLGGALEYQRISNQFASLDTLLQQEIDHLSMAVSRIEAHHPNVVLVEKNVSRHAQERLLSKEIALVLNVKRPLLERIARCTGANIVSNPDHLSSMKHTKVGHCELFHVEKYVEEHGSAGQGGRKLLKTLMFFDGCPKPLGCTVMLKGSNGDVLKKVKRTVQFAVFAAYHLALETSFFVDEGANLPDLSLQSPLSVALPDKQSKSDRSISTVSGFLVPTSLQSKAGNSPTQVHVIPSGSMSASSGSNNTLNLVNELSLASSVPRSGASHVSSLTSSTIRSPQNLKMQDVTLSDTDSMNPSITNAGSRLHESIHMIGGKSSPDVTNEDYAQGMSSMSVSSRKGYLKTLSIAKEFAQAGTKSSHYDVPGFTGETDCNLTPEALLASSPVLSCVSSSLTDDHGLGTTFERMDPNATLLDLHQTPQLSNQDGGDQEYSQEDFPPSPSDHQSILVSFSSSCLRKATICARGHVFRIKYYGTFDKPLGRFLRDTIFDQTHKCPSCGEPKDAHVDCYTHQQGNLTISVHRQTQVLPGESEGKIWMWHRCLKCTRIDGVPPATCRLVMSDAAWGLSFGKFLELSFSNHAAASRVASCGHTLQRDCLRFYGFGSMVACFRYSPVNLYSVYLPPSKLEFHCSAPQKDWLKQEIHEVAEKGKVFFAKAFYHLHQIEEISSSASGNISEVSRRISESIDVLRKQQERFEACVQKAAPSSDKVGQPHADILQLNCIRRALLLFSSLWESHLQSLLCSLKSSKPAIGFDSLVLGESFVSFLKDDTFASNTNIRYDDNKVIAETNVDGLQLQVSGSPASQRTLNPNAIIQQEKHRPILVPGLAVHRNVDNKACNYSTMENMLTGSSFVYKNSNKDSFEGSLSEDVFSTLPDNKMIEFFTKPETLHFRGIGVEDGSCRSNSVSGSSIWTVRGMSSTSFKLLEGKARVHHRALSEGQFSASRDLSATFDAAWTGNVQSMEADRLETAPSVQEIIPHKAGNEIIVTSEGSGTGSTRSAYEIFHESSTEYHSPKLSSEESEESGIDSQPPSTLMSPAKAGEPTDIEGWVGAPYSSLCRPYSRNAKRPLIGSPPGEDAQLCATTTVVLPFADQAATQESPLPVGINDMVVSVYNDEPTSIIAYVITSKEHQAHLSDRSVDKEKQKDKEKEHKEIKRDRDRHVFEGVVNHHPLQPVEGSLEQGDSNMTERLGNSEESILTSSNEQSRDDPLLYAKAMHMKVSFTDDTSQGKTKYTVTCYYAKHFDALRKKCCPNEVDFIRSLCRCKKWGAQGGKSNVFFAKTADDRFVIKQVTKTELESFITFAPAYFKYISDALNSGSPTCLAKILGIYQVIVKHGKGGKEVRMDLMVMENLLYGRQVTRVYDLKGSLRSRYNAVATGKDAVLLDQNLLESMQTKPIFISNRAKRLLERAVWNDTAFLASVDVMDYSLLVGIDEGQNALVLGIIDFLRQYTWDKHLETWVKASGILGGHKNAAPTVISPKQYKKRFRKAMSTYFLMVPDKWSPPNVVSGATHEAIDESSSSHAMQDRSFG